MKHSISVSFISVRELPFNTGWGEKVWVRSGRGGGEFFQTLQGG